MDHRRALRLCVTEQTRALQFVEIALRDIGVGEGVPAAHRKAPARRIQFDREIVVVDVVGREDRLDAPLQQLGIIDDRTVECDNGTRRVLAVGEEVSRLQPDGSKPRRRASATRRAATPMPKRQRQAAVDQRSLEVGIGQTTRDGRCLVAHSEESVQVYPARIVAGRSANGACSFPASAASSSCVTIETVLLLPSI